MMNYYVAIKIVYKNFNDTENFFDIIKWKIRYKTFVTSYPICRIILCI